MRRQIEGCDTLLISCTGLRGADTVAPLETELGIPAITSNVATVWVLLRALGLAAPLLAGRLVAVVGA